MSLRGAAGSRPWKRRRNMFDKLNYIRLSDKEYPIKCDMLVLERIQDEFGSLSDFENKLNGFVPAKDESGNYKRTEEGLLLGCLLYTSRCV